MRHSFLQLFNEEILNTSGYQASKAVHNSEESRLSVETHFCIIINTQFIQTSKNFHVANRPGSTSCRSNTFNVNIVRSVNKWCTCPLLFWIQVIKKTRIGTGRRKGDTSLVRLYVGKDEGVEAFHKGNESVCVIWLVFFQVQLETAV